MSVEEITIHVKYEGESRPVVLKAKHLRGLYWKLEAPRRKTTFEASDVDVARAASAFVQEHLGVRL